jgi:hypothetical protein
VIQYEVPDMHGRPWAHMWEKYFEQGMQHPAQKDLFDFKQAWSATHGTEQHHVSFDRAWTVVLHRVQVHFVMGDRHGRVIDEWPVLDADAPILMIDVEGERVAVYRDVVQHTEL